MTETLPEPPTSVDVDISGLDGFMLDVQRLFASELWALSTGDEFKAAVALWGRAWQQIPAGSLPNDERILASFSGSGKDWKKVRAMALRGFVECSDGRLYHKVLCEDVLNAHRKRQAFRERTKAATEARRQRNDARNDQRNVVEHAIVTSVQGQGQGQGHKEKNAVPPIGGPSGIGLPSPSSASPTPESELFRRGKEVLGPTSGGLVSRLLQTRDGNIPLARAALETASTKAEPREYLGAVINGNGRSSRDVGGQRSSRNM